MSLAPYPKLIEPKVTRALMDELGCTTKKRFGQNFLIDERVLSRIIEGAGITKDDTVLEIGPGIGTMTQALSEAAGTVIAVEIDKDLIPVLGRTLSGCENVTVIHKDVLAMDLLTLDGLFSSERDGKYKVVANLPYYITTPILMKLLESGAPIESITVMVQKEVAGRMQAPPGGKDYGALSLAVQYYCETEIIANVPQNSFIPRPNVDSAVIRLRRYETPPVVPRDREYMFTLIRQAFSQRRKTLVNTLKSDPKLGLSRERIEETLREAGLPPDIRGERLSLSEFSFLSDRLRKNPPAET